MFSIFSFLPPSTTIRSYQRRVLATTVAQLGTIYCASVSFASNRKADEPALIVQSLLAIRRKLKRSLMVKENVTYEVSRKWGCISIKLMYVPALPARKMAS